MSAVVAAVIFLPLIAVLWLANMADRRKSPNERHSDLAALTYGLLVALYIPLILFGFVMYRAGSLPGDLPAGLVGLLQPLGIEPAQAKPTLFSLGLAFWLPGVAGLILVAGPVRRLLAQVMPIDPSRTVHAVALSFSMLIVTNLLFTIGLGLRSMVQLVESGGTSSAGELMLGTWIQDIAFLAMALLGVGWLSRRSLRQALGRLGLVLPSRRQVALGAGVGLLLIPVVMLIEALSGALGVTANPDVAKLSEALVGPLFRSLPGVLTIGLAAALGEEAILRGAVQPRFGLLPTAALFAFMHWNYGLSLSTLIVVVLALALGLLRERANTTTSMIAHAVYNMALGLIGLLALR